jgi:hypothetical protein
MANLSGTWLGTYWQDDLPTRFELTLVQGGNTLSGSVLDDNYLGEATISGEVIGRRISFTKRYLGNSHYSVEYTGTISEDEKTMRGGWLIQNLFSGTWEANREEDNLTLELSTLTTEKVPLGVV